MIYIKLLQNFSLFKKGEIILAKKENGYYKHIFWKIPANIAKEINKNEIKRSAKLKILV